MRVDDGVITGQATSDVVGDASKHRYLESSRELACLVDELRFGVDNERCLELDDEWIGVISSLIARCFSPKTTFTSR